VSQCIRYCEQEGNRIASTLPQLRAAASSYGCCSHNAKTGVCRFKNNSFLTKKGTDSNEQVSICANLGNEFGYTCGLSEFGPLGETCEDSSRTPNLPYTTLPITGQPCQGYYSECNSNCEMSWITSSPASGSGPCIGQFQSPLPCIGGLGQCPRSANCRGYYGKCSSDCIRYWTTEVAPVNKGTCPQEDEGFEWCTGDACPTYDCPVGHITQRVSIGSSTSDTTSVPVTRSVTCPTLVYSSNWANLGKSHFDEVFLIETTSNEVTAMRVDAKTGWNWSLEINCCTEPQSVSDCSVPTTINVPRSQSYTFTFDAGTDALVCPELVNEQNKNLKITIKSDCAAYSNSKCVAQTSKCAWHSGSCTAVGSGEAIRINVKNLGSTSFFSGGWNAFDLDCCFTSGVSTIENPDTPSDLDRLDKDCVGKWSPCGPDCVQIWLTTQSKVGQGTCPDEVNNGMRPCNVGDGQCTETMKTKNPTGTPLSQGPNVAYSEHDFQNCGGTGADVLRDFAASVEECKQRCSEDSECGGFIRVHDDSPQNLYSGKCFLRRAPLQNPYSFSWDKRSCYEKLANAPIFATASDRPAKTPTVYNNTPTKTPTKFVQAKIPADQPKPSGLCDWQCYLDRYVDLQNAYGNDVVAAEKHYESSGASEGRDCTCDGSKNNSEVFSLVALVFFLLRAF